MGRFLFESERTKAREAEMKNRRCGGGGASNYGTNNAVSEVSHDDNSLRQARQSALDVNQLTWEEN